MPKTQAQLPLNDTKTSWPYHIMPLGDFREHDCVMECWCNPTLDTEFYYGGQIVDVYIHHGMDRREEYEEGRLMS